MGMSVRDTATAVLAEAQETVGRNILAALAKLGEECVARIRDRSPEQSWIDHTGNLRSSIGYAVIANGRKEAEGAMRRYGSGTEGTEAGRRMLESLTAQYAKTYALVVAAGMDYASYVEGVAGKDVLASAELWARRTVKERLENAVQASIREMEGRRR